MKVKVGNNLTLKLEFILLVLISVLNCKAQCVSSFPNTETFETAAVWTSGGVNNDWVWGTPTKPTINSAGGGVKCWNVGGLTGSSYASSQESYIKSPCYNFSTLTNPYVSLKIFWESEKNFDGASLQYSINSGLNWLTVGAFGDPQNCTTQNWYNSLSITYLNWLAPVNKNGWSGNNQTTSGGCQGGNGSTQWKTAKHCLSALAGKPNVVFRIVFGSGSLCNNFDGFAIDDFTVADVPLVFPVFTYTCNNFSASYPACPMQTNYTWNFGDGASGVNITSTLTNPTHNFSTPGSYTVFLTANGATCNSNRTYTNVVVVAEPIITATNVQCFNDNTASAQVVANFGAPAYSYTWLPSGGNNALASSLSAGNYSVIVKDANGCIKTQSVTITTPLSLNSITTQTNITCAASSVASASVQITGGVIPYTYLWQPSGGVLADATNLSVGNYTVTVSDANLCKTISTITITSVTKPTTTITPSSFICSGTTSGSLSINTTGGLAPFTYTWLPVGGNAISANNLAIGNYTCYVTDANNCSTFNTTSINQNPPIIATTNNYTTCANTKTQLIGNANGGNSPYTFYWNNVTNGSSSATITTAVNASYALVVTDNSGCQSLPVTSFVTLYPQLKANFITDKPEASILEPKIKFTDASIGLPVLWQWNFGDLLTSTNTNTTHTYNLEGNYTVQLLVEDTNGCKDSITKIIKIIPEITFFAPNAITPNGDGLNDVFIPKGTGWEINKYELWIFDRWGGIIFNTKDPLVSWNAKGVNNKLLPNDNYVWKVELTDVLEKEHVYVGNVLIAK